MHVCPENLQAGDVTKQTRTVRVRASHSWACPTPRSKFFYWAGRAANRPLYWVAAKAVDGFSGCYPMRHPGSPSPRKRISSQGFDRKWLGKVSRPLVVGLVSRRRPPPRNKFSAPCRSDAPNFRKLSQHCRHYSNLSGICSIFEHFFSQDRTTYTCENAGNAEKMIPNMVYLVKISKF